MAVCTHAAGRAAVGAAGQGHEEWRRSLAGDCIRRVSARGADARPEACVHAPAIVDRLINNVDPQKD